MALFVNTWKAVLTHDGVVTDCAPADPSYLRTLKDVGPELTCIGQK
jgi:hypothetical protein